MLPSRRDLIRGAPAAALGVTSLTLPSSAAAVSPAGDSEPTEPLMLVGWTTPNTDPVFVPETTLAATDVAGAGLSGTYTFSGMTPVDTNFHRWTVTDGTSALNTSTSPYLQWSLTTDVALDLQYLAITGSSCTTSEAVTVTYRHDGDSYGSDLRSIVPISNRRNLLVDLSTLGTTSASSTLRIRMYVHDATSTGRVMDFAFGGLSGFLPFEVGTDEYISTQGEMRMAFLGNYA